VPEDIGDAAAPPSSFDSGSSSSSSSSSSGSASDSGSASVDPPKKAPPKPKDDLCYKKLANGCCSSDVSTKPERRAGKPTCPRGFLAASGCKISDKCPQ
jgi:hypothetical protein